MTIAACVSEIESYVKVPKLGHTSIFDVMHSVKWSYRLDINMKLVPFKAEELLYYSDILQ